jgi:hypothetical protein
MLVLPVARAPKLVVRGAVRSYTRPAMNRASLIAVLLAALAPGAAACPELPHQDPTAAFRATESANAAVVEYFSASKNADAARASSLIDYPEWAKEMGLDDNAAKRWALAHRLDLEDSYREEKEAGSTKAFKIVKGDVLGESAVFDVTQERADGVYLWEVKLRFKHGRWVFVGFRLLSIN